MPATALVLSGYGLNCEMETAHAFTHVGIATQSIHVNDLIHTPEKLTAAQIFVIPGGFSYGDDTGSGNALAQKLRLGLWESLQTFFARDTLTLGICNGCQTLVRLGMMGEEDVGLTYNAHNKYECRWVDAKVCSSSPWLYGIERMHIPVAHGEGRFVVNTAIHVALHYIRPDGAAAKGVFPFNPNGSMDDIAGITDATGRILALMPHPERGMYAWQRDDYPDRLNVARRGGATLPIEADGMALFANAARYFAT